MNNSKKILKATGLGLTLALIVFSVTSASASYLELVPETQVVDLGASVRVDIFFSDPGNTRVGAFDFSLNYDPDILTLDVDDIVFGSRLGGAEKSWQEALRKDPNSVSFSELSFMNDLSSLQDGLNNLLLVSLTFEASGVGGSALSLCSGIPPDEVFLVNEEGMPIELETIGTGSVRVVPLPASVVMLLSGLAGMLGLHRISWRRKTP